MARSSLPARLAQLGSPFLARTPGSASSAHPWSKEDIDLTPGRLEVTARATRHAPETGQLECSLHWPHSLAASECHRQPEGPARRGRAGPGRESRWWAIPSRTRTPLRCT